MHNDSIETLLLRHYGSTAQAPVGLEQRLCASVRHKAAELHRQEKSILYWRQERVSRRSGIGKLISQPGKDTTHDTRISRPRSASYPRRCTADLWPQAAARDGLVYRQEH